MKTLKKIVTTTVLWAGLWGLAGALAGVVMILIDPDTGHIPAWFVPFMIGVPSAVFGAGAGLVFALILVPASICTGLGNVGRILLGALVGGIVGICFMKLLAHSALTPAMASVLSAFLGARYKAAVAPSPDTPKS